MIHESNSTPSNKQKTVLKNYTEWKVFMEIGRMRRLLKKEKRNDYFSEGYLTSDDLEIPEIPFLSQFETLCKVLHLICCPRDCCFSFLPPPLPLSSSSFFFYLLTMLNLKLNCYQMVEFKCGLHCTVCKCYRTFSFVIKNIKNLIRPELILIKIELIFKFICR